MGSRLAQSIRGRRAWYFDDLGRSQYPDARTGSCLWVGWPESTVLTLRRMRVTKKSMDYGDEESLALPSKTRSTAPKSFRPGPSGHPDPF